MRVRRKRYNQRKLPGSTEKISGGKNTHPVKEKNGVILQSKKRLAGWLERDMLANMRLAVTIITIMMEADIQIHQLCTRSP